MDTWHCLLNETMSIHICLQYFPSSITTFFAGGTVLYLADMIDRGFPIIRTSVPSKNFCRGGFVLCQVSFVVFIDSYKTKDDDKPLQ